MSRLGKNPVVIPENVKVEIMGRRISCEGKQGKLSLVLPEPVEVRREENKLFVCVQKEGKKGKALRKLGAYQGLARALCYNLVTGVSSGFEKILELQGVGYRAEVAGSELLLHLGYSHPYRMAIPPGLEVKVDQNRIIIRGADKEQVGNYAAQVRKARKVEPYKGKGIRYLGEQVRRKAGKAGKVGAK